jgi:hypothetical protein
MINSVLSPAAELHSSVPPCFLVTIQCEIDNPNPVLFAAGCQQGRQQLRSHFFCHTGCIVNNRDSKAIELVTLPQPDSLSKAAASIITFKLTVARESLIGEDHSTNYLNISFLSNSAVHA